MNKIIQCCFNWKVVAGLAGIGLTVALLAPTMIAALVPTLLLAICPLSMLAMIWFMQAGQRDIGTSAAPPVPENGRQPTIADLKAQLTNLQAHQEVIARKITALEDSAADHTEPLRAMR